MAAAESSECKAATAAAALTQESNTALSLSLSQRNVDHFCFQYEIIDGAVDSGSKETRAHEQVLRPHSTSPCCRKWSAARERERATRSDSLIVALSVLPQSTLLGALFGACLASLNNVISESVWRCVCISVTVSVAVRCAASADLLFCRTDSGLC